VDSFDIALEGVSRGRDANVLAVAKSGGETGGWAAAIVTADELGAVIDLPDKIAQRDAAALEMLLNAGGE